MRRFVLTALAGLMVSSLQASNIGVCMVRELLPLVPIFYDSSQEAMTEALDLASEEMQLRESIGQKMADLQRAHPMGPGGPGSKLQAEVKKLEGEYEKFGQKKQRRELEIERKKARAFHVTKEILAEASARVMKKRKLDMIIDVDSVLGLDEKKVADVTVDIMRELAADKQLLQRRVPTKDDFGYSVPPELIPRRR